MFTNQNSHPSPVEQRAIEEAFRSIYGLVDANLEDHFVLTSSGEEAVNHAVFSTYLDVTRKTGKNHFLCASTDEAAAILSLRRLKELGCVFQMVPVDKRGVVTKDALREMLTPRTAFFTISAATALTGVVQPVAELAEVCQERGVVFHVEASHILGKLPFSLHQNGVNLLSFNGSYPGGGGLFIPAGMEMSPFILGGNEQGGMRAGSYSYSALIGLGKEVKKKIENLDHGSMETARVKNIFEEILSGSLENCTVLFQESERTPHLSCLLFSGVTSDALGYLLEKQGIHSSFGGNKWQHLVHLLKSCGIEEPDCHCGLSFAFPDEVEEKTVKKAAEKIIETVHFLRNVSQHLMEEFNEF